MALPKVSNTDGGGKAAVAGAQASVQNVSINTANMRYLSNIDLALQKQNEYFKQFLEAQKEANARMAAAMSLKDDPKASAGKDKKEAPVTAQKELEKGWLAKIVRPIAMGLAFWATGIADYLRVFQLPRAIKMIGRVLGIGGALGKLVTGIRGAFSGLATALSNRIFRIADAFSDVWGKRGSMKYLRTSSYKTLGIFSGIVRDTVNFIARVEKAFKGLITGGAKFGTAFGKIGAFFSSVGSTISKIVKPIGNFFSRVGGFIKSVMAPIVTTVGKVFSFLSPIMTALKTVFRYIGGPVSMIIFAAIDGIIGFIDGFKSGGLLGGLEGAFTGIIKGIFTKPLDLLKDLVGWLAGLMGFKEFKKWLGEWSFTEGFDKLWTGAKEMFSGIANWFETLFTNPVEALDELVPESVKKFGTWMYNKAIKPIGDWFGVLFSDPMAAFKGLWDKGSGALGNFGQFAYDKAIKPVIDGVGKLFEVGEEGIKGIGEFIGEKWDNIKNFGGKIYDNYLKPILDSVGKLFDDIKLPELPSLGDIGKFVGRLLKAILPPYDMFTFKTPSISILGKKFGGGTYDLNPIPKALYHLAEASTQTSGEIPKAATPVGAAADKLAQGQAGADDAKAAANAKGGATVINAPQTTGGSTSDNSTNTLTIKVDGRNGGKANQGASGQHRR